MRPSEGETTEEWTEDRKRLKLLSGQGDSEGREKEGK